MAFNDFIVEEEKVFADYYKNWEKYTAQYPSLTAFTQAYNMMDEYIRLSRSTVEFEELLTWIMGDAERAMQKGLIQNISDDKPLDKLEAYLVYYEPIRQKKYANT